MSFVDVHCSEEYCPAAIQCSECTAYVCPEHDSTGTFVQCVADPDRFHHDDACADACSECHGAAAEDHEADLAELYLREGR